MKKSDIAAQVADRTELTAPTFKPAGALREAVNRGASA